VSDLTFTAITPQTYAGWFSANHADLLQLGPFHDPSWLAATSRGTGFDLAFVGVVEGEELTAVMPGFLTKRGPLRLFGSPLRGTMTSYLGPVFLDPTFTPHEQRRRLIRACAGFAKREWRLSYARVTVRDASTAEKAPATRGWKEQRSKSYRLDLTPGEETLFAGLKSDCRRNIRRATREGIEIVPLTDPTLYFRMLEDTMRRHGSSSWHKQRFFDSLFTELPARGLMWAWGAQYEEQIIGAGLFFHDQTEMHFLSGASLDQYGSLPTSYLLHWHAIAKAVSEDLGVFNSEASGIRSIDRFKEAFNPALERRSSLIWESPIAVRSERLYRSVDRGLRRIRSLNRKGSLEAVTAG
jgi:hypothetical protein